MGAKTYGSLLLGLILYSLPTFSQITVTHTIPSPNSLSVCEDTAILGFEILSSGVNASNVSVRIVMATGVRYVDNSIENNTAASKNVAFSSIHEDTLWLSAQNFIDGENLFFSLKGLSSCQTLDAWSLSQPIVSELTVFYNGNQSSTSNSPDFSSSIKYADLSITQPNSPVATLGESITRSVTINNSGTGCLSSFLWYDLPESDVQLDSVQFQGNTLPVYLSGDTNWVSISSVLFTTFGDNDGFFCSSDGPLVLTEFLTLTGCTNRSSVIGAEWGCENIACQSYTTSGDITLNNAQPSLIFEPIDTGLTACFHEQPNHRELRIINQGNGSAIDLEVEIKKSFYSGQFIDYQFDGLDTNSVKIKYNSGNFQSVSLTNIEVNTYYTACSQPYAYRFQLVVPLLGPGDTATIGFDMINCVPSACGTGEIKQGLWGYNYSYDLPCSGGDVVGANQIGGVGEILNFSSASFDPPTLNDGKTSDFTTTIQNYEISYPGDGQFIAEFILPNCGTVFSGSPSDLVWTNIGGNLFWPQTSFQINSDTVVATFDVGSIPQGFGVNGSEIILSMEGDCSCPAGDTLQSLMKRVWYVPHQTCTNPAEIAVICDTTSFIVDPCDVSSCDGIRMYDFDFERINFGVSDNNLDRIPDSPSGSLAKARTNRARLGDTLRASFTGFVDGPNLFDFGYSRFFTDLSAYLSFIEGSVRIWDASSSAYLICNQVNAQFLGSDEWFVDYSGGTLSSQVGCGGLTGFQFATGDSIILSLDFVVSGTSGDAIDGGAIYPVEMYLSQVINPSPANRFACSGAQFSGLVQLVPMQNASFVTQVETNSCNSAQARTFIQMFTGGSYTDMFPFEFRPWSFPDSLIVTPPDGYTYESASVFLRFTPNIQAIAIDPLDPNAYPLIFDLEKELGKGTLNLPDDGYELQFFTNWIPNCESGGLVVDTVAIDARFHWEQGLESYDTINQFLPRINHKSPEISLSNLSATTIDGLTNEVEWRIQISNTATSSQSPFTWLSGTSPSGLIQITEIIDEATGMKLANQNKIFQVGQVNSSSSRDFTIRAQISKCSLDTLLVLGGWNCGGYPDSLSNQTCAIDTFLLRVSPQPANAILSLANAPADTVTLCEGVDYNFSILSTQAANVQDLFFEVLYADSGLTWIPGSVQLEYPLGSGFQSVGDPVTFLDGFRFDLGSYDSVLNIDGLQGLQGADPNRRGLNLKFQIEPQCNYDSGDPFTTRFLGIRPCGDSLVIQQNMNPMYFRGAPASYTTILDAEAIRVDSCKNYVVQVNVSADSTTTGDNDWIQVRLPASFDYHPGYFASGHPFTDVVPDIVQLDSLTQQMSWQLPEGIAMDSTIDFLFGVTFNGDSGCHVLDTLNLFIRSTYSDTLTCNGLTCSTFGGISGADSVQLIFDPYPSAVLYTVQTNARISEFIDCQTDRIQLAIYPSQGITLGNDSIHIIIPNTYEYLDSSFSSIYQAPLEGNPTQDSLDLNVNRLSWALPEGIDDSILFSIVLSHSFSGSCPDSGKLLFDLQTTYSDSIYCIGKPCWSSHGETSFSSYELDRNEKLPEIQTTVSESNVPIHNGQAIWEIEVRQVIAESNAPLSWLKIPTDSASVIIDSLIDRKTGIPLENVLADSWELGPVHYLEPEIITVYASVMECSDDSLAVFSGWACDTIGVDSVLTFCQVDSVYLSTKNIIPKLSITVVDSPMNPIIPCESHSLQFWVTNTDSVPINHIQAKIFALEANLYADTTSAQIRYVGETIWRDLPSVSTDSTGLEIDLSQDSSFAKNGLKTIGNANGMDRVEILISFVPSCNFSDGEWIELNVFGETKCEQSVIVNKEIGPYHTQFMASNYGAELKMETLDDDLCSQERILKITFQPEAFYSGPDEILNLYLPDGLTYVSESTTGIHHFSTTENRLNIENQANRQVLTWPITEGINPLDSMVFSLKVVGENCTSMPYEIQLESWFPLTVSCGGNTCTNQEMQSGSNNLSFDITLPDLTIPHLIKTHEANGLQEDSIGIWMVIENQGAAMIKPRLTTVEIYCDSDLSSDLSADDQLLGVIQDSLELSEGEWIELESTLVIPGGSCSSQFSMFAAIRANPDPSIGPQQCLCDTLVSQILGRPDTSFWWISFVGWPDVNANILRWEAVINESSKEFVIERKPRGSSLWEVAGTMGIDFPKQGLKSYYFRDEGFVEVAQYRIRHIFTDGIYIYSPIITIDRSEAGEILVYPNPTVDEIFVKVPARGILYLSDSQGRSIKKVNLEPGTQRIELNGLSSGIYFVEVNTPILEKSTVLIIK